MCVSVDVTDPLAAAVPAFVIVSLKLAVQAFL
jgi:hypothetical protein